MVEKTAYETVIGLEIHVQLATRSKVFCADDATFGGTPNTHTSVISLAHPGTLPRLNKQAVEYAVRLGLALGCSISPRSTFDRKNYFYADLPKGFQTTQAHSPICMGGFLGCWVAGYKVMNDQQPSNPATQQPATSNQQPSNPATSNQQPSNPATSNQKPETSNPTTSNPTTQQPVTIRIHHIHLEEDAGKSLHDQDPLDSLIDLNRAGVPLLEIVTEPDLRSAEEVVAFMTEIRRLVRWIGISDGNMEEGSLRCDVNVSVRRAGAEKLGNRCEIKNMNSMRFARRAIEFEVKRQIEILENGGEVVQETRGFDPSDGMTYSLREKEDAHDYRYFPEPDLPPVVVSDRFLEKIKSEMPALPWVLEQEFQTKYGLPAYDAEQLAQEREVADYFQRLTEAAGLQPEARIFYKPISNLIINKLLPWSNDTDRALAACPVRPKVWVEFLSLIEAGQISASAAYQRLFPVLLEKPDESPVSLAIELNLLQSADSDFLEKIADEVLARFPEKTAEYRKGKKGLIGFFMGEVMKASKGKAEPKATQQLLENKLK